MIETLITQGIIYYGCGGAIGFDLLAGETVLKLKKKYPQIKLIMVLPCVEQDKKWHQPDKDRYRTLLEACDKLVYVQRKYDNGCMLKRNRHLADHSSAIASKLSLFLYPPIFTQCSDKQQQVIRLVSYTASITFEQTRKE